MSGPAAGAGGPGRRVPLLDLRDAAARLRDRLLATFHPTPVIAADSLAPDFTLETDEGQPLSLRDLRGRWVVLFFYPKDDTPGCTKEACNFRDALPRFAALDAVVLGISPDDARSHRKFREKFALPYPLLSDTGHAVAEAWGVWQEKSMYGRKYWGVARTTFLVAPDGTIAHVFEKVKPDAHGEEVVAVLARLQS